MRGRSKSLNSKEVEDSSNSDDDDEYQKSIDMNYEDITDKEDNDDDDTWSPEDKMMLLRNVWLQLPKNDKIPFDERLKKIDWNLVAFDEYDNVDVKRHFKEILSKMRTYRLLGEIVKDVEKTVLSKLNLPIKPLPPMALFIQDNKEKVKKYMSQNGIMQYGRGVAGLYNTLSEEQKLKYKKRSLELRKKYKAEVSKYSLEGTNPKSEKKQTKSMNTPLGIYVRDRTSDSTISEADAQKEYGTLNKDDKLVWILRWVGVKKGQKLNLEQHLLAVKNCTREEIQIIDEYEGRPKTMSAYQNYLKDYYSKISSTFHKNDFKAAGASWKNLSEEIRDKYHQQANKSKTSYMADCMRFTASLPKDRQEYEIKVISSKTKEARKSILNTSRISLASRKEHSLVMSDNSDNDSTIKDSNAGKCSLSNDEEIENVSKIKGAKNDKTSNRFERKRTISETTNSQIDQEKTYPIHEDRFNETEDCQTPLKNPSIKIAEEHKSSSDTEFKSPVIKKLKFDGNQLTDESHKKKKKRNRESSESHKEDSISETESYKKNLSAISISEISINSSQSETEDTIKKKKKKNKDKFSTEEKRKADLTTEYLAIIKKKPPESVLEYYAKVIYDGPKNRATKAYNLLDKTEKEKILKNYEKAKKKFLKKFEAFSATLSKDEYVEVSAKCKALLNEDDQSSDESD